MTCHFYVLEVSTQEFSVSVKSISFTCMRTAEQTGPELGVTQFFWLLQSPPE